MDRFHKWVAPADGLGKKEEKISDGDIPSSQRVRLVSFTFWVEASSLITISSDFSTDPHKSVQDKKKT